jgi:hypothetical protein
VVVIAGHHHYLALRPQGLAHLGQDARSRGERVSDRALAELDHIPQEDEAIHAAQRLAEKAACIGVLEAVPAAPRAQVEI